MQHLVCFSYLLNQIHSMKLSKAINKRRLFNLTLVCCAAIILPNCSFNSGKENNADNELQESPTIKKSQTELSTNIPIVKMGTQYWMIQNLEVEKFRNGKPIVHAETDEEWKKAAVNGTPAWSYLKERPGNSKKVGKLYNWHTINLAKSNGGLAPKGFHIPSKGEFRELKNHLGWEDHIWIEAVEERKYAEEDVDFLRYGFSAYDVDIRSHSGTWDARKAAFWVSSPDQWQPVEDENGQIPEEWTKAWSFEFDADGSSGFYKQNIGNGLLIRCIKN